MTNTEIRILYLIRRNGEQPTSMSDLINGMDKHRYPMRKVTVENLQKLGVIEVVDVKCPHHNKQSTQYRLTPAGRELTGDLMAKGEMKDPTTERRGKPRKVVHA